MAARYLVAEIEKVKERIKFRYCDEEIRKREREIAINRDKIQKLRLEQETERNFIKRTSLEIKRNLRFQKSERRGTESTQLQYNQNRHMLQDQVKKQQNI